MFKSKYTLKILKFGENNRIEPLYQRKWWVALLVAASPNLGVGGTLSQEKQVSAVSITEIHS